VRPLAAGLSYPRLLVALAAATLVPLAVVAWAQRRAAPPAALWGALLVQAVVLLNVVAHVATAVLLTRGYTPGLATAVVVNLPFSLYLLRRAERERWLGRGALVALAPAALAVHGPLLLALLMLAATAAR